MGMLCLKHDRLAFQLGTPPATGLTGIITEFSFLSTSRGCLLLQGHAEFALQPPCFV